MLYFLLTTANKVLDVSSKFPELGGFTFLQDGKTWIDRTYIKDFATAEMIAIAANAWAAENKLFNTYIAVDSGPNVSPRYDVIDAPSEGKIVSKGFNGDYYPCGYVTKVSKTFRRVETSTGEVFHRVKQSGSWKNGGFFLVEGHRDERNPSF